ncbi:GntR family transcriptional regulator [Nonomuraea sp. NPDC049607]|uniref:GntR family transcriptional regulator n=1 Tax=Nonomuraea sp. NPDC049607 TaxID=3154732 RepID=UPI00342F1CD1
MREPAYVRIAGQYARRIRSGELPPRVQLPSYRELAEENGVSEIVVRRALDLLKSQGLVQSVQRRGVFVAGGPERQAESPDHVSEQGTTLAALALEISNVQARLAEIERDHGAKLEEILRILRGQDSSSL